MIHKKSFNIWIRPWIFTKLMLPVQAAKSEMPCMEQLSIGSLDNIADTSYVRNNYNGKLLKLITTTKILCTTCQKLKEGEKNYFILC